MGYYINPPSGTKEDWLAANGERVYGAGSMLGRKDQHAVCLVDNGGFSAAGIAYNEGEYNSFCFDDGRPRQWFLVDDAKLIKVCPGVERVLEPYPGKK